MFLDPVKVVWSKFRCELEKESTRVEGRRGEFVKGKRRKRRLGYVEEYEGGKKTRRKGVRLVY